MTNFDEIFTLEEIAEYYNVGFDALNRSFWLNRFFPNIVTSKNDISWIKGSNNTPVLLKASELDAAAEKRSRIGAEVVSTELPFFREKMSLGEKDIEELSKAGMLKDELLRTELLEKIFADSANLVSGALATAERERAQIITLGKVEINSRGTALDYDYNRPAGNYDTPDVLWTEGNSTPLKDIIDFLDKLNTTVYKDWVVVMNKNTKTKLINNEQTQAAINAQSSIVNATSQDIYNYISAKTVNAITLNYFDYNDTYLNEVGGTASHYIPDGYVVVMPNAELGKTYYGRTPEMIRPNKNAMNTIVGASGEEALGTAAINVSYYDRESGGSISTATVASCRMLPSCPTIDNIYVLKGF